MACYFARLDESNIVIQIIVVADNVQTADGDLSDNPCHPDGETYCRNLLKKKSTWKQYFMDGSHRVRSAGIGYTYDKNKDAFIALQPYPSWSLDNHTWVPPVARPENLEAEGGSGHYSVDWDEENQRWTAKKLEKVLTDKSYSKWNWNPVNTTWEAA